MQGLAGSVISFLYESLALTLKASKPRQMSLAMTHYTAD
jgi:hypothetical protein